MSDDDDVVFLGESRPPTRGVAANVAATGSSGAAAAGGSPPTLTVATWNVDGLSDAGLAPRAAAVAQELLAARPDAILLQELVAGNRGAIAAALGRAGYSYHDASSGGWPYHVGILLRTATLRLVGPPELRAFDDSGMGRHVLGVTVEAVDGGARVRLLTAHLESTADAAASACRRAQLGELLLGDQ